MEDLRRCLSIRLLRQCVTGNLTGMISQHVITHYDVGVNKPVFQTETGIQSGDFGSW